MIEWEGKKGTPDLPKDTLVRVWFRDGITVPVPIPVKVWRWRHLNQANDIVAYEVVEPPETAPQHLPTDAAERKGIPVYSGFMRYFPDAIIEVAKLSKIGNDQHNPGKPLHWDRSKSGDELDAMCRHLLDADEVDTDDVLHATKVAWRAMANLQKLVEKRHAK